MARVAREWCTSLVRPVVNSLFVIAKKKISYMSNYSKHIEHLKVEIEKLTQMRGCVEEEITAAKENGLTLRNGVEEWVNHAQSLISDATEVVDWFEANANKTCFTLYSHGKKAVKIASSVVQILEHGKTFESQVSVYTPGPGVLDAYQRHNINGLDTHKLYIKRIMRFIKDDNIQIIGIHGIGGVGKTTLAKEVAVSPMVKSLFAAVEFITVSQPVDAERIKKEFEVAGKRIINSQKILVILDDVWEELKLDELGIPCGSGFKNCKILLTSRSEDVCKTMNATGLVSVATLPTKEAWILFKRVVGDTMETDKKLKEIAEEIVEGCGGLPLILQVVGATLKNESIESSKRAVTQLQKHTYSQLQQWYDRIESEEAKSCFLLCNMFPQDFDIPLERLVDYGVGLNFFNNLNSIEDARNRVRHAVKILKSSCLLLDRNDESTVKMSDIVREVALFIASNGNNKFLVKAGTELKEWKPRIECVKSYKGISLIGNCIENIPDYELQIQHLDIFLIQENYLSVIPDKFILGAKEATVLDFEANQILSLPPSLKQLSKLCVLNLGGNESVCDISILGDLESLEILILSNTGIVKIPQEIGNLVKLRRLEVKGCPGLSHIAPSVMSKLRRLEELHIGYYGVEDRNNEGLMEIGELSMLTFLDLFVPHIHLIPKDVCFRKLKGFVIQIGGRSQVYDVAEVVHKKTLILGMEHLDAPSMLHVKELIDSSNGIIFEWVMNPNNIVPKIYCESWNHLTTIMLYRWCNLLSLVDSSYRGVDEELGGENTKKQPFSKLEHLFLLSLDMLRVLWKCPDQYISLENLVTLHISDCNKLVRLFSVNTARGLVKLKSLTIQRCRSLEEVIWVGDESDNINKVVFDCLVKIELSFLKTLKSFYAGKVIIKFPSLEQVEINECIVMDKWGSKRNYDTPTNLKLLNQQHSSSIGHDGFPMSGNPFNDQITQVVELKKWPILK